MIIGGKFLNGTPLKYVVIYNFEDDSWKAVTDDNKRRAKPNAHSQSTLIPTNWKHIDPPFALEA